MLVALKLAKFLAVNFIANSSIITNSLFIPFKFITSYPSYLLTPTTVVISILSILIPNLKSN